MNLMKTIRVSTVVVGLGFVTLVPRVCHAQAEVNPDFYDDQPATLFATSAGQHGLTTPTRTSLVPRAHPDCKNAAGDKGGCSVAPASVRTRRSSPSNHGIVAHQSGATPNGRNSSRADAQLTEKSTGG
jgi:hypothetical protein